MILMKPFAVIYNYVCRSVAKKYQNTLLAALRSLPGKFDLTLIDIGAARDIEPRWKRVESFLNYIGAEPDERSRNLLLTRPNNCLSYSIIPNAIWDSTGTIDINLCKKPMVSSFYPPYTEFVNLFPYADRFTIESVENLSAVRLDDLSLKACDFIKIDIQGGELNALKGARTVLQKTIGVELEVEFLPIYKGQPLFGEIQEFLDAAGFEFIDFISICRWERTAHNGFGQCIFGDALFLRTPEKIIANSGNDITMIAKYLGICVIYNRYDLIDRTLSLLTPETLASFSGFVSAVKPLKEKHYKLNRMTARATVWMSGLVGGDYQPHLLY
jgi:FkbM family methyltransferase